MRDLELEYAARIADATETAEEVIAVVVASREALSQAKDRERQEALDTRIAELC